MSHVVELCDSSITLGTRSVARNVQPPPQKKKCVVMVFVALSRSL